MWKSNRRVGVAVVMMALMPESGWSRAVCAQSTQPGIVPSTAPVHSTATQPATAPAATSRPGTRKPAPKRDREFHGHLGRPPLIYTSHISAEIYDRLCGDLRLSLDEAAALTPTYLRYFDQLEALAIEQDERHYQWELATEAELAGPEIVIPEDRTFRDLSNQDRARYLRQERARQMGLSRARFGNSEYSKRASTLARERHDEATSLERGLRPIYHAELEAALPEHSRAHWERAMRMLAINLDVVQDTHPQAMISDPQRVDLHQVVREAAKPDDGELRGLVNLPGLDPDPQTAAQIDAINAFDQIMIDYEVALALLLDEDPAKRDELQQASADAFNRGDFDQSRAIESKLKARTRPKYDLKTGTAKKIAEFLTSKRDDAAANRWIDRFNHAMFPALHFPDSAEEMNAWATSDALMLTVEQRAAIDGVMQQYLADRQRLRDRIMPLLIDVACDPNAMISLATGEMRIAQSSLTKAQGERIPLAERANKTMRGVLEGELQKQFDLKRDEVRKSQPRAVVQPEPA